jgi:hypothetical protein
MTKDAPTRREAEVTKRELGLFYYEAELQRKEKRRELVLES